MLWLVVGPPSGGPANTGITSVHSVGLRVTVRRTTRENMIALVLWLKFLRSANSNLIRYRDLCEKKLVYGVEQLRERVVVTLLQQIRSACVSI